jgi:hypothetical protein
VKLFKHRGRHHVVGTVVRPSAEASAAQRSKGLFHEVLGTLPPPPDSVDYVTAAQSALATPLGNAPDPTLPAGVSPVGDCVIAADLHLAALRACNAGAPFVPTTPESLTAYSAVTGYVQGNVATDQGTDPLALLAWRLAGNAYPDGSTLLAAIDVDTTNEVAYKQAIWLADGVLQWASLPDPWESEEDGGDVWDVAGAPDDNNGHGFGGVSYGKNVPLSTWGEVNPCVELTFAAAAKYCVTSAGGGCVALIGSNAFERISKKCPAGYDLSGVKAYLASLGAPVAA